MNKKELINSGKVKSVFTTDDDDKVIIEFRDDMTAGDGERKEVMNKKGAYNAVISAKIFKVLEENGVETQFIDLPEPDVMLARKLDMIPIEVIVRNIATGSLIRKYPIADGTRLEPPIVQMDFKADEYHDPMLNDSIIKALGIATQEEIDTLTEKALKINEVLKEFFADAGIILVDYKVEFGKDKDGNIILGDEISPDSCRLWDAETLDMLDKELFRQGKDDEVIDAYEEVFNRLLTEEDKEKWGI
jgi:phosphoribosylaminoimidazole-succinocarboxamide synthase